MEYYIPGLGICNVKSAYGGYIEIVVDAHEDDLKRIGAQEIVGIHACGECGKNGDAFKDDYRCLECKGKAGEIEFDATWDNLLSKEAQLTTGAQNG